MFHVRLVIVIPILPRVLPVHEIVAVDRRYVAITKKIEPLAVPKRLGSPHQSTRPT
jgi:hypothetical protein